MNQALRKPVSTAEFLEWEERQELRYEFDGSKVVAMTGGTAAHATIQLNVAVALSARLRGTPCRFFGSDLKIELTGRVRYPDGFVVCTPVPPQTKVVRDPVVIFEVMSESTQHIDLITKNREYSSADCVRHYVILSQFERGGLLFARVDADWVGHLLTDESVLDLSSIGATVPLSEFYEGLDLAPETDTTTEPSP